MALVRSIVAGNKVLLLDEPTAALDPALKNELCYLLKEIRELYQLTIIMVTHDIEVAYMVGDQLVFDRWPNSTNHSIASCEICTS